MRTLGSILEELTPAPGYAALGDDFVEARLPTPLSAPYLVAFNAELAATIGLRPGEERRPEFLALAAGNGVLRRATPTAAVYAGHQFGSFVPQLGDGRAITLGEIVGPDGEPWEWQVKGAGRTAFSRFGDGRAVLRSTIREYLCSEAMHGLGVPTTRALAIAGSDEPVYREVPERAAVLSRLAPSHLRFGTFEYFAHGGRPDAVRRLADYAIGRFYPECADLAEDVRYARFLEAVVGRTAELMAAWQSVGFAHGVMNTDNFSVLGLTLDYGPFGFLDAYDPTFVCNHTDAGGRYAFDRQPLVGLWNCRAFAVALASLVDRERIVAALERFAPIVHDAYVGRMRAKLGLASTEPADEALLAELLDLLAAARADYAIFFRTLGDLAGGEAALRAALAPGAPPERLDAWFAAYRSRLGREARSAPERAVAMRAVNPKYVLRNYLAQNAIVAAERRDYGEIERLHRLLRAPFDEHPADEAYAAPPPAWACEISVSCSS